MNCAYQRSKAQYLIATFIYSHIHTHAHSAYKHYLYLQHTFNLIAATAIAPIALGAVAAALSQQKMQLNCPNSNNKHRTLDSDRCCIVPRN